jgi:hypothetical protein
MEVELGEVKGFWAIGSVGAVSFVVGLREEYKSAGGGLPIMLLRLLPLDKSEEVE